MGSGLLALKRDECQNYQPGDNGSPTAMSRISAVSAGPVPPTGPRGSGALLLAVHVSERCRRIALARRGARGQSLVELGKSVGRKLDIESAKSLGETVAAPRADERYDVVSLRRHP